MQSALCTDRRLPWAGKKMDYITSQNKGPRWCISQKILIHDLLLHLFTTFAPLLQVPKSTRLRKSYISTWKYSLLELNFSPICRNTLGRILLDTMADSPVCFTIINNFMTYNPSPHMVVPFILVLLHWKSQCQLRERKWDRQQLRNFKHKVNHEIGCFP